MSGLALELVPLAGWAATFMIAIARLSFVVFLMPGIGEQVVPNQMKVLLLLGVAMAFTTSGALPVAEFSPFPNYAALMAGEVMVGLFLGASLRVCIWILNITGAIVAQAIGLAQFLGVALDVEAQTLTANLLSMAGAAILLAADYHVSVFVSFLELYNTVPVGGLSELDHGFFIESLLSGLSFAILLAWPFVTVNLIYNIALGFINKALPQMMVAFVGAPFMVGAGLFLLGVSIVSLLLMWKERVPGLAGWV